MSEPATTAGMNTLVAVAIAPCGTGDELSAEVAEVVRVIRESGLPNRTTSMFTEIEGDWDEVMQVVRDATFVLASKGIRTEEMCIRDSLEHWWPHRRRRRRARHRQGPYRPRAPRHLVLAAHE